MYKGITITAHTGCEGTAMNSLEAIRKGAECGADAVEFDVRFDGKQCVLSHDKQYSNPVTLKAALEEVKKYDGLMINVDLKEFNNVKEIIAELEEAGVKERTVFTGAYSYNYLHIKKQLGDLPLYINAFPTLGSRFPFFAGLVAKRIKKIGAQGINTSKKFASKCLVEAIREEGLFFSVWTVKEKSEIKEFVGIKPDNITTKIPAAFKEDSK